MEADTSTPEEFRLCKAITKANKAAGNFIDRDLRIAQQTV
jgi:hypothetical protein